jgi:hypothetical protein
VDNALDACEEAEVLPDVFVGIKKVDAEVYRITVEDNGPGIVPENVPRSSGSSSTARGSTRSAEPRAAGDRDLARCCMPSSPPAPGARHIPNGAKARAHRFELMIRTEINEPRSSATRRSTGTGPTGPDRDPVSRHPRREEAAAGLPPPDGDRQNPHARSQPRSTAR